jgi:hypothetical protein
MCRQGRSRIALVAAAYAAATLSCHLVQPQTYTLLTKRAGWETQEYLLKELVTDMPEEMFIRWYTRDPSWPDPLRPCILGRDEENGRTAYDLGTGHRTVLRAFFRDGRLEAVGGYDLTQEGPFSYWGYGEGQPTPLATEVILARMRDYDPFAEPLRPQDFPDPRRSCNFENGARIQSMQDLRVERVRGTWMLESADRANPRDGTLPAGSVFVVHHWSAIYSVLDDGTGRHLHVALPGLGGAFCEIPCFREGDEVRLTRSIVLAEADEGFRGFDPMIPRVAYVPGQSRVPVWMKRRVLKAGERVRLRWVTLCEGAQAGIQVPSGPGAGALADYYMPVIPRDLFAPIGQAASIPDADF